MLCKLINKLSPGSVKKIKEKGPAFMLMENVQAFQAAIKKYGVPDMEIFQTADLFEGRNIPQVNTCLHKRMIYYIQKLQQICILCPHMKHQTLGSCLGLL